jgi:hypothetical protein
VTFFDVFLQHFDRFFRVFRLRFDVRCDGKLTILSISQQRRQPTHPTAPNQQKISNNNNNMATNKTFQKPEAEFMNPFVQRCGMGAGKPNKICCYLCAARVEGAKRQAAQVAGGPPAPPNGAAAAAAAAAGPVLDVDAADPPPDAPPPEPAAVDGAAAAAAADTDNNLPKRLVAPTVDEIAEAEQELRDALAMSKENRDDLHKAFLRLIADAIKNGKCCFVDRPDRMLQHFIQVHMMKDVSSPAYRFNLMRIYAMMGVAPPKLVQMSVSAPLTKARADASGKELTELQAKEQRQILGMCARYMSFAAVMDPFFREFVGENLVINDRNECQRKTTALAKEFRTALFKSLGKTKTGVSLLWDSSTVWERYVAVVARWQSADTKKFEYALVAIAGDELIAEDQRLTIEALTKYIDELKEELVACGCHVLNQCADNGSNFRGSMRNSTDCMFINCFAHGINLMIKSLFDANATTRFVPFLKAMLERAQAMRGEPGGDAIPVQADTRWHSAHTVIDRASGVAAKNLEAAQQRVQSTGVAVPQQVVDEAAHLALAAAALKPFVVAIDVAQADDVTVFSAMQALSMLNTHCETFLVPGIHNRKPTQQRTAALQFAFAEQLRTNLISEPIMVAVYYSQCIFFEGKDRLHKRVKEIIRSIAARTLISKSRKYERIIEPEEIARDATRFHTTLSAVVHEFTHDFLEQQLLPALAAPLKSTWAPFLGELLRVIWFLMDCSEAKVERVFSKLKITVPPRRSSIDSEAAGACLLINCFAQWSRQRAAAERDAAIDVDAAARAPAAAAAAADDGDVVAARIKAEQFSDFLEKFALVMDESLRADADARAAAAAQRVSTKCICMRTENNHDAKKSKEKRVCLNECGRWAFAQCVNQPIDVTTWECFECLKASGIVNVAV